MKQDMQNTVNGLPAEARRLVLAKAQEWQPFAGEVVRLDQESVANGLRYVLTFENGSIGTVITPLS
jgi:hypothetical protein